MRPAACAAEEAWKRDLPAVKEPTRPARACGGGGKEQQRGQQRSVESELRLHFRSTADIRRTADLGVVLGGKSEGENRASGFQCDHDGIAVGSSPRDRRSVPPPSPIAGASSHPGRKIFPLEGVHFYPHLRAEFTSEDGAGGARLGDEASGGAAPRGDGGDLAERTADGTHRGHLVLSCCEVSLIRSIVALPAPACAGRLGFFFDCLRVLTCLGAHFPKTCTTPARTLSACCRKFVASATFLARSDDARNSAPGPSTFPMSYARRALKPVAQYGAAAAYRQVRSRTHTRAWEMRRSGGSFSPVQSKGRENDAVGGPRSRRREGEWGVESGPAVPVNMPREPSD